MDDFPWTYLRNLLGTLMVSDRFRIFRERHCFFGPVCCLDTCSYVYSFRHSFLGLRIVHLETCRCEDWLGEASREHGQALHRVILSRERLGREGGLEGSAGKAIRGGYVDGVHTSFGPGSCGVFDLIGGDGFSKRTAGREFRIGSRCSFF